jgi:fucose permease
MGVHIWAWDAFGKPYKAPAVPDTRISLMSAADLAVADRTMHRGPVTWFAYLSLGYFTYLVSIQGNIIPFLQADLGLSYTEVSLHPSAIAVGMILVGLFGDRLVRPLGRRLMLTVSAFGCAGGAILLCLASAAWVSVGACLAIGLLGAFIPAIVPAVLSDIHGPRRDIAYAESNALCYAFAATAPVVAAFAAVMGWNWRLGIASGAAAGVAIALRFIRTPIPENLQPAKLDEDRLPPAFWAYWAMLSFGVALEFAVLLWAPAYLEKVIGLSAPAAAIGAGAFFAAMLIGRTVGVRLFRMFSLPNLFFGAVTTTLIGFVAYWGSSEPIVAIPGLFVVGLGIAMLFPLILSFAMAAAGPASDRAATRTMVGPGVALLLTPPLLGAIADQAGLRTAQLMIPVFVFLAFVAFITARAFERARSG